MQRHFNLYILIVFFLSFFVKAQNNSFERILKSQLLDGESSSLGEEFESHKFSEKDLEAIIPIIKQELKNNNFQFLKENDFNTNVKSVFSRTIDSNSDKNFLYVNFSEKCDKDPIYSLSPIYPGSFIIKKDSFITELYAIPQIFDYQKEFPDLARFEVEKIIRKNPDLGQDIEIPHWKDLPNLKEIRKKYIQTIVARNMYPFNDSKPHFKWLILNDEYFMTSLVKFFGFTDDQELLKWIVKKTKFDKNNPSDYGKIFWRRQCDGSVKLHSNTFELLQKLYQPDYASENRFILYYIKDYLEYLGDKEKSQSEGLKETDRVKIMSNLAYFAAQYKYDKRFVSGHGDGSKMMGRLRSFLDDNDIEILKKK